MSRVSKSVRLALAGAAGTGIQAGAWAQSIGYVPDATAVPTLSEWAMIVLSVLMAVSAVYFARKGGHRLMALLLGLGALTVGASVEETVVRTAQAIGYVTMSSNGGGTVDLSSYLPGTEVPVQGNSTIPMRVISVTPSSDVTVNSPTCTVGLLVPASSVCYYKVAGGGPGPF